MWHVAESLISVIFFPVFLYYDADLDSGGQDGSSEFGHIDAQEVTHFLCSCGEKENHQEFNLNQTQEPNEAHWRNDGVLPVSSGMDAWSECRSFLNVMFPS